MNERSGAADFIRGVDRLLDHSNAEQISLTTSRDRVIISLYRGRSR